MSDALALDKIARILHDQPISSLSSQERDIALIVSTTTYGRIEEAWNWSRTKRVKYFVWTSAPQEH